MRRRQHATGDGCSATCQIETPAATASLDAGEECDDGNTAGGDGCSATCQYEGFAYVRSRPRRRDARRDVRRSNHQLLLRDRVDSLCCAAHGRLPDASAALRAPCTPTLGRATRRPPSACARRTISCRTDSWDQLCLDQATEDCGACGGGVCGNGKLETAEQCDDGNLVDGDGCDAVCQYEGSVCVPRDTPGADDNAVVACTCNLDAFCCGATGSWDATCVNVANTSCNAACGSPCSVHANVGSNNGFVTQCVCETGPNPDPFCCENSWDAICVGEADNDCNALCP